MHSWHDIAPERIKPEKFIAMIEISKGSKNKYELDKETGHLILDRVLFTSTHYPANYGFIPRTYAKDYDPLDVLVLCSETILPMGLVHCTPIGVMAMVDNGLKDDKIIAVCDDDPFFNHYKDIEELPLHIKEEIKHFFLVYKSLEGKSTSVGVVKGKEEAIKVIKESIEDYEKIIEPTIKEKRTARGY